MCLHRWKGKLKLADNKMEQRKKKELYSYELEGGGVNKRAASICDSCKEISLH